MKTKRTYTYAEMLAIQAAAYREAAKTAQEVLCGTAPSVSTSMNKAILHTATTASPSEELPLLPEEMWKHLTPDRQEQVRKWFELATKYLQSILDMEDAFLTLTTDQLAIDRHDAELRARVLDPEISKKFTYCAYCGHTESVDVDGEVIAAHIRTCEMHPLNIEIKELRAQTAAMLEKAAKEGHMAAFTFLGMEKSQRLYGWHDVEDALVKGAVVIRALIPTDYATALADRVQQAVRDALQEVAPIVEFYLKREIESPANHQEFARDAQEKLDRFRAAARAPEEKKA